jgi:site-specific DNA recombinase
MRGYLEEQLARAGVRITYLTYEVEDTKEGRAKDGMLSVFNEWERETIVQRMRDGRERRMHEGYLWRGARPYGWRYIKAAVGEKYGHLEIVPEEAAVIRQIFAWILEGRTQYWIAGELNRRGTPSMNGTPWTYRLISHIVHNHLHSGRPVINRYEKREPKKPRKQYRKQHVRSSSVQRPREEWKHITIPLSIVTPEVQDAALERLRLNRVWSSRNTKHPYLLSGLLRCGWERLDQPGVHCGRTLTGAPTDRRAAHFQYRCNRQYPSPVRTMACCRGRAQLAVIEPLVWQQIVTLLQQPEILLRQMDEAAAEQDGAGQRLHEEVSSAAEAVDRAQDKLAALLAKNLAGQVDDATYQRVQADLVAQREAAKERLAHARGALDATYHTQARWANVREYCAAVADKLAELEQPEHFARRKELVQTLVTTIWVYSDHVRIEGVLPAVNNVVTVGSTPRTQSLLYPPSTRVP